MEAGYRNLPPYYDRWQKSYGKDFSTLILPRLIASIRVHRISGRTMVDVACGTGTLALLMAGGDGRSSGSMHLKGCSHRRRRSSRASLFP